MWSGKMQPIVETVEEFNNHTRDVNAELNLRFRLQSIFFRLSIFNEVISFSIKHISVRQSNFPLVYIFRCVCCFFSFTFSLSLSCKYPIWFSVAHRWIQIKLFICMIVVIQLIRKGFSLLYFDSFSSFHFPHKSHILYLVLKSVGKRRSD